MRRDRLKRRRVLLDTRQKNWHQNPYVSLLAESIEPESVALGFTWAGALFGKYDVVHVHWPEYLLKHRTKVGSLLSKMLFVVWLCRLKVFRVPVVKTMHNRKPHDSYGRIHGLLLGWLEESYTHRVWLMPSKGQEFSTGKSIIDVVIPHGDYVPWLESMGVSDACIQELNSKNALRRTVHFLCFGIIKRYKNIHEPVAAVADCLNGNVRLSVKGMAPDTDYLEYLHKISADDHRINILPGRLDDDELVNEILAADVVLLPYPDLYNSGVLLLALSLGRPVALRSSSVALEFQREFGPEWVITYDGELSPKVLERIVLDRSALLGGRYVSEKRNWISIGEQHNAAYSLALRI